MQNGQLPPAAVTDTGPTGAARDAVAAADDPGSRDALAVLLVQAIDRRDDAVLREFVSLLRGRAAEEGDLATTAALGAFADVAQAALEHLVLASQRAALLQDTQAVGLLRLLARKGAAAEAELLGPAGPTLPAAAELLLGNRLAIRRRAQHAVVWEVTPRGRAALNELERPGDLSE